MRIIVIFLVVLFLCACCCGSAGQGNERVLYVDGEYAGIVEVWPCEGGYTMAVAPYTLVIWNGVDAQVRYGDYTYRGVVKYRDAIYLTLTEDTYLGW